MQKHYLLVSSNPQPGQEAEFNSWYNSVHLPDLLAVPGVVAAQRFARPEGVENTSGKQYLAIYEIETDSLEKTMQAMENALPGWEISPAIDQNVEINYFSPVTERITSKSQ